MGGERGQTAAEYLGVMVVITAVVGTIATSDLGRPIATEAKALVCEIAGGSCATATATAAPAKPQMAGGGGPKSGPAIGAGERLPVLGFPGSVSVKCTATSASTKRCAGGKGNGAEAGVRAKGTVSRSGEKLTAAGCPTVTLSTKTALEVVAGAKGGKGPVTVSGEVYGGRATSYDLTVSPDRAEALEDGAAPPNPVDPTTLGVGESIQMSKEFYAGAGMSAQYRAIKGSFSNEKGRRISTAVTRVDDSTVRVYAGDDDFLREATALGIGAKGASVSIGNARESSEGELSAIDIDISTEGGWETYQRFVASGRLPQEGDRGASDATTAQRTKGSSQTQFKAEFGPLSGAFNGGSDDYSRTVTTNADGSRETVSTSRLRGVSIAMTTAEHADGSPKHKGRYALTLNGVDPNLARTFAEINGEQPQLDGDVMRLEFTEADLDRLSDQAVAQIQDDFGDDPPSAKEIRAQLRDGIAVEDDDHLQIAPDLLLAELAKAKDGREALVAFMNGPGFGDANGLLNELNQFAQANDDVLGNGGSGDLEVDDAAKTPGSHGAPDCA